MTPSIEDLVPAPSAPATIEPGRPAAPEAGDPDAAAWAGVLSAWDDEARHRAYLARFRDLEGLATAGGRYRAVLAERPGDAIAARFRDEVLRRAVAQGLVAPPRSLVAARPRRALRIAAGLALGAILALAGYLALDLLARGAHA